ncbi:uncharacterized protein LOC100905778 [Galendromus occidentalis]|uniref:Uncharacterized protein LOC100905778 n=1 Tax=Galendromus occidentalis TaxID=34638 RepID=A0AAJ6VXZ9_9ACAR|nr:uncharacterized protein LOC100905778 [Galendromus occidentalis]
MKGLTPLLMMACFASQASAASFKDLEAMFKSLVDDTVPPEKQQKFKDGFANMKGCVSALMEKIDFKVVETLTAAVTSAGVECGKQVQGMNESQQQEQFMPCVKQQLQDVMSRRNDAEKAAFMQAKDCLMGLFKSS